MEKMSNRARLLVSSAIGGVAAIIAYISMLLVRELAGMSPLCPDGLALGKPLVCTYAGIVLPQYLIMAGIAVLLYLFLRRHFKYSFFISFFAIGYAGHLSSVIGWLHNPFSTVDGIWLFYILLFLLGSMLFLLLYFYFVKLKMWLWLKLFIALVVLFPLLPLMIIYIGRVL